MGTSISTVRHTSSHYSHTLSDMLSWVPLTCLECNAEGDMLPGDMTNFGSGSFTWTSGAGGGMGTGARKMSLTLPGEVPLSAYENMALSLQKKTKGQTNKRDNNSRGGAGGGGPTSKHTVGSSSHTAKPKPKPRIGTDTGTSTQNPLQKVPIPSSSLSHNSSYF